MSGKPILGILLGDAAGVGPEIIVKLAASRFYDEYCRPIVIGIAFKAGIAANSMDCLCFL